jgi:hypothetical protein
MAAQTDYPPPPWRLNASAYISIWRLPMDRLASTLSPAVRPVRVGRKLLIAAGFVFYERGSDLEYNELFLGILTRNAGRIGITIPLIWVDSPISQRAGRELWSIPKQLARFEASSSNGPFRAATADQRLGQVRFERRAALPFRIPITIAILQQVDVAKVHRTAMTASTSIELGTAEWTIPEGSPLRPLAAFAPLLSMRLRNARIRFGA